MHPLSGSFQSPEEQEFAREEQALEDQARQLMLVDTTLAHELTEGMSPGNSQRVSSPVDKGKGKGKAETPIAATLSTPRTTPIAKATLPCVEKFPQLLPEDCFVALTEAERAMTVEQWVRHEMDRQYERMKSDGRQKIDTFKARAIEVAQQIERL